MKRDQTVRGVKGAFVIALAAIACCCLPFASHASSQTASVQTWMLADANKRFTVSGTVQAVSYVTNSIHLNENGQRIEIVITPTTAIEVRGESGSISDIRRGSKITATGVIRDGVWVANSVVIH